MARGTRCRLGPLALCVLIVLPGLALGAPQADGAASSLTLDPQRESVGMLQTALRGFQARVEPQGADGARPPWCCPSARH